VRNCIHKIATRGLALQTSCVLLLLAGLAAGAQPEILRMCPNPGPEGTRVQIIGRICRMLPQYCSGKPRQSLILSHQKDSSLLCPTESRRPSSP
jgi:hypothetical protein